MGRITIEEISNQLEQYNWKLISEDYKNLDTELEFLCNEGHHVFSTWKKIRNNPVCPICNENEYLKVTQISSKPKGAMRVLALDQASRITGYALFENKKLLIKGTYVTHSDEEEDQRLHNINEWFQSALYNWEVDLVGIEGIQFQQNMGVTTFQTLARLQGILINTCIDKHIRYQICPTNTWRHHCGVKGQSRIDKKRSMQLIIKQEYDITVSDDIADAIGIGKYVVDNFSPNIEVVQWE